MIYLFDKSQKLIGFLNEKEELTKAQLTLKINEAATLDLELPANSDNLSEVQNVKYVAVPYPDNEEKLLFLQVMTRTDEQDIVTLMAKEYAYQELSTSGYIKDKRYTSADARTLMTGALSNSGYTLQNTNVSGNATTNFYYIDYLTAISNVIDLLGGEIKFYVTVDGNKISGKYVDYVIAQGVNTSKVFAYGSNLISIEKQSDASSVYTAILPRGKGELVSENDNGPDGYGRRITIEDVVWTKPTNPLNKPAGSLILEDPSATAAFGQANGTARLLLQTYDDIDSPQELIQAAYKDLQSYNHPAVQFTASVANIGDSGLGDTIVIMHSERGMSYRTRIFQIEYDLIELGNTIATFGDNLSKNNTSSMLANVSRAVDNAKEIANNAIVSANSINDNYYSETEPANPKNGDTWFYTAGDGFGIRQYVNGQWVEYVNSKTSEQITAQVDAAISNAKEYADELNTAQTQATNSVASDLAKKADELTKSQQAISSQATAYTDSAVADANSKAVSIGQSAAQNAQSALDTAKKDFTSSFASQASQTASMASDVTSKASQYVSQAKSEAIAVATSADGVVRTEFKSTTDSMTATIQKNKSDADGKISTAQTTATQALDGLSTKVSQTEYNTKTGQLQTDLNTTTQTANQAKTDIVAIKQKNGEQDERMNSIVSDANGTKQTISDLKTVQGKQSGDIATLQSRADGFEATVTKVNNLSVGGRNYILNSSGRSASTSTAPCIVGGSLEAGFSLIDYQDDKVVITNNHGSGEFFYGLTMAWTDITKTPLIAGNTYTLSVKARGTSPQIALRVGYQNMNPVMSIAYVGLDNTKWTKATFTFTIPAATANIYMRLNGGINNNLFGFAGNETIEFKEVKLELGNVSTDWTPAPEDLSSATAKAQLTADQATVSINNYKTDADGRISKAQADIVANTNAITQKVSQSDYNTKTGELTTSVSKAQQTADTATQTIGTYKESNDKRVAAAETNITANADAIKLTASKTELNQATGKLSGDISTLQQRADGFEATVTKVNDLSVGGRNLLLNSAFINGFYNWNNENNSWTIDSSTYQGNPVIKSPTTTGSGSRLVQRITNQLVPGSKIMVSFNARGNDSNSIVLVTLYNGNSVSIPLSSSFDRYTVSLTVPTKFDVPQIYFWNTVAGNNVFLNSIKVDDGNVATDWSPAPEDVDTQLAQVKITADGVYQTVNNPQTGLNTRVSTAEGNINSIKSNVSGISNTVTQTSNGLTQEIADRKTGDSNTLQAGKDFTTSQITSYDTGMQSRLSQVSDGIMAQVSATNLIVDSSFVNALANWTLSGDVNWKIDTGNMHEGVRVAKFDNGGTVFDRKTATLTSIPIYTINLGGTQFYASFDLHAKSFGTSAYFKAEIVQKNSSGTTTKTTAIGGSFDTAMSGWANYTADVTLDPTTTQLYLQFTQYGGGVIYVSRPYLGSVQLQKNAYIAGASTDNSSTLKLFNNFFAFGIQSNTGALISGINGDDSGLNIVGKKITVSGDTTFIGNNFMDGAIIKNASIGSAQIADAAITNAKISNLDVNKLSGNISSFIQTNWNGKYGATTIDSNGMKVETSGVNTQFGSYGMTLNMTGESVGGIGVQGFAGKPSDYQGLTFWLDGNAEYMAWGARDSGVTSGNPITKLGWFRSGSNPIGTSAGFNFDDDVIFNRNINVQGPSTGKFVFGTQNFNNANYPFFGDKGLRSGIAYGTNRTYLISDGAVYNLSVVIMALSGLGAVKIPSAINSDGTVAKWFNVTL